mmetsp:Transcript_6398/g.8103  ORF Transcript_6398/g.8103 Transcript_6398/m.8103 type:complete len:115 (+) Transcript_6398:440-784(+)
MRRHEQFIKPLRHKFRKIDVQNTGIIHEEIDGEKHRTTFSEYVRRHVPSSSSLLPSIKSPFAIARTISAATKENCRPTKTAVRLRCTDFETFPGNAPGREVHRVLGRLDPSPIP